MGLARKISLGVGLDEACDIARRRIAGDALYGRLDYLNIGFQSSEILPPDLPQLLQEAALPVVVHGVDINLSTNLSKDVIGLLRPLLDGVGAQWFEEDLGIWTWNGMYLGSHQFNPLVTPKSLHTTVANIKACRDALGRPINIENPPTYFVWGDIDLWDYMSTIAEQADCGLILDIGHIIGYHVNTGRPLEIAPSDWPGWSRIAELHFSGFELLDINGECVWYDRHSIPFDETLMNWGRGAIANMAKFIKDETPLHICLELDGASEAVVLQNMNFIDSLVGEFR